VSKWLTLLNELKGRSPRDYFTETQLAMYQKLIERLDLPGQIVNLSGAHGAGKTFVAWGLSRISGAQYLPMPNMLYDETTQYNLEGGTVLIDNAPTQEEDVRQLLAQCGLLNINSVMMITVRPVSLKMHRMELTLPTLTETDRVLKNLRHLGFYSYVSLPPESNFWQILQACV